VCASVWGVCVRVCMCLSVRVCVSVCLSVCGGVSVYVTVCVSLYVSLCVCVCVCLSVCFCMCLWGHREPAELFLRWLSSHTAWLTIWNTRALCLQEVCSHGSLESSEEQGMLGYPNT